MKTFAIATIAATAAAIDADFIRGCQTGFFIMNDAQIDTYECPAVTMSPDIQMGLNMAKPAIAMAKNMNPDPTQPLPLLAFAETAVDEFALLYSVLNGYEGTQYCAGIIFSHEIAKFALNQGKKEMSKYFPFLEKMDQNN